MKRFFLFTLFACYTTCLFAQRPPLDHSAYKKWPEVASPIISNNGVYVIYSIYNSPPGSRTLVIKSINKAWKREFIGGSDAFITQDSQRAVFKLPGDSLCLLVLGTDQESYVSRVSTLKAVQNDREEWMAYQSITGGETLTLQSLLTGRKQLFNNVTNFLFGSGGNVLLLETVITQGPGTTHALQWVNLQDGKTTVIWKGRKPGNYVFDAAGSQLIFTAKSKSGRHTSNVLWYYRLGMRQAMERVNDKTAGMTEGLAVSEFPPPRFSQDGQHLFFSLKQNICPVTKQGWAKIDVWHYEDERLQSEQLNSREPKVFTAVIHPDRGKVIRLTGEHDIMAINGGDVSGKNDHILVWGQPANPIEVKWNLAARPVLYVVSTRDGTKKMVKKHTVNPYCSLISSGGRYVVYFDSHERHYFSYNIESGATVNITKKIQVPLYDTEDDHPESRNPVMYIAGWLPEDKAVLIYDLYDIWKVDPAGIAPPECITAGYGRKHHIVFRLTTNDREIIPGDERLLLSAFNRENKHNGFYQKQLSKKGNPELLNMGPYIFYLLPLSFSSFVAKIYPPVKAARANAWIVKRESATEAPNYYYTRNFKSFTSISHIAPQKQYNWMRAELLRWKTFDGSITEGILYKPQNFDPEKRYPLLFYFYERLADRLHVFLKPAPSNGVMNIPFFVSNGYLVCTPDIHYKTGQTGESVYNAVVSATRYLLKMPWVDSTKMGIQGHSFGGYEVNYLVTRTDLFAAAASSAGPTNLISNYGGLNLGGFGLQGLCDDGQIRLGSTPWQKLDLYTRNSPVLRADEVTTPLLIMHNELDDAVPFSQAMEWFMALRRADKKVWLLQYGKQGHQLGGKAAMDYTERLAQFFDHYLKGVMPPKWMTETTLRK